MRGGLSREDFRDDHIVDQTELASDGNVVFINDATVVSTVASTKVITFSGIDIIDDPDENVEANDIIVLSGTSGGAADGVYTVNQILSSTTLNVVETIADSTGGTADFKYPPGASKVGFDASGLTTVTADNVQDAIEELDAAAGGSGMTTTQHKTVRQLIHFVETNSPGEGFGAGPYQSEILPNPTTDIFPTSETWYETSAKTNKICRWEGTYNANKTLATEKWIIYKSDGTNPAAEALDTISYSGVFETGRSRAITVY